MATTKKSKVKKQKTLFLVKWGSYDDDPVEEFTTLEAAKAKVLDLIDEGEELDDIRIYSVLSILKPVSKEIIFQETK